jgi:hypothetical protein
VAWIPDVRALVAELHYVAPILQSQNRGHGIFGPQHCFSGPS